MSPLFLHYGLNLHLRSLSSTPLHDELQNEIAITAPTTFLQISNVFAERVSPNRRTRFLQITKNVFSKSPNMFSPNCQCISPHVSPNHRRFFSKSPRYFTDQRAAYVLFCSLWRRPCLRSLPTRATGSALCIMGGRLWFLSDAYSSYTCTGSALDVMDFGLAMAGETRLHTNWSGSLY